jgi:O-antigen/teichoic acid export membrane protein
MSRGLFYSSAIYAAANALSAGIPFLLLPILTRALAPEQYGLVIDFFLLSTLCSALAGLGMHAAIAAKWFDREQRDFPRLVGNAVLIAIASTVLCGLLTLGGAIWFDRLIHLPLTLWGGAAVYAGANVVLGMRTSVWQSQRKPFSAAALQVCSAALNVALSLVGVFVLGLGGEGRALGALVATAVMAAFSVMNFQRRGEVKWQADRTDARQLLRFGIGLAPHTLAGTVLATMDRLAVSAILGPAQLGIYGTAAQLGMAIGVLGDAFVKAFSPWMYEQMNRRSQRARLRIVGATYTSIPLWLSTGLLLWAALVAIGPSLLGESYRSALQLSLWFFIGGALSAVYTSIAGIFFFTSKNEWLAAATMLTAATAAVLAPAMTRAFGVSGAGAAYVATQALLLSLSWLLSRRVQPMPWGRPLLAVRLLWRGGSVKS